MSTVEHFSVWKKRGAEEKRKRELAIEKARSVAQVLKKKHKAKEVILFGSLIWRPGFLWSGTDIDLMVKGLKAEKYFEILADVSVIALPFQIDIIPFEIARPPIKKKALKEGLKLE